MWFLSLSRIQKKFKILLENWHQAIFPKGYPLSIVTPKSFNHQIRDGLVLFQFSEDTSKKTRFLA